MSEVSVRKAAALAVFSALTLAGCGNTYRPVVTTTAPTGPAEQPERYAVVISSPSDTASGLVSFVDAFGDTLVTSPSIPANPTYIALTQGGGQGFVINTPTVSGSASTLSTFGTTNPPTLLTSNITNSTLPSTAAPTNLSIITLNGSTASVFVPETQTNRLAALNSSGELLQELTTPAVPQYVVGVDSTPRIFVLNANGTASGVESTTTAGLTISSNITVGTNPVYGVMTTDARRAFVLNKGSQSVSVINVVNNALDSTTSTIAIPTVRDAAGNNLSANPVWADINPFLNELAVLSQGDGVHGGLLTLINIPLCSAAAQTSNPSCNANNPVDAANFGTIAATVPVGVNPTQVQVLRDTLAPRAYVTNSGNSTTSGSVSVVNMNSGVVTSTIPVGADSTTLNTATIFGLHPSTLAVTAGTPAGRVFVTSTDSRYLTIIYTDTDSVSTHVPIYGAGRRVVVTQP